MPITPLDFCERTYDPITMTRASSADIVRMYWKIHRKEPPMPKDPIDEKLDQLREEIESLVNEEEITIARLTATLKMMVNDYGDFAIENARALLAELEGTDVRPSN